MGESIINLLGPLGGVEGSIVATMEGWNVHGYEYNNGRVDIVLLMYLFCFKKLISFGLYDSISYIMVVS